MQLITLPRLNRALRVVQAELDRAGLWAGKVAEVDVYLVPLGWAYGWQYADSGNIHIPAVSIDRLKEIFGWPHAGLRDVLRHEYAHVVAWAHPRLVRARAFREAFGRAHRDGNREPYDPDAHVTAYAAKDGAEDFAEVFMYFLKHGGRLPRRFDTPAIRRKWAFVRSLLRRNRSRFFHASDDPTLSLRSGCAPVLTYPTNVRSAPVLAAPCERAGLSL